MKFPDMETGNELISYILYPNTDIGYRIERTGDGPPMPQLLYPISKYGYRI